MLEVVMQIPLSLSLLRTHAQTHPYIQTHSHMHISLFNLSLFLELYSSFVSYSFFSLSPSLPLSHSINFSFTLLLVNFKDMIFNLSLTSGLSLSFSIFLSHAMGVAVILFLSFPLFLSQSLSLSLSIFLTLYRTQALIHTPTHTHTHTHADTHTPKHTSASNPIYQDSLVKYLCLTRLGQINKYFWND